MYLPHKFSEHVYVYYRSKDIEKGKHLHHLKLAFLAKISTTKTHCIAPFIFSHINTFDYPTNIPRYSSVLIRQSMYILAAGQLAWLHLCKQIVRRAERFALARNGLLALERYAGPRTGKYNIGVIAC